MLKKPEPYKRVKARRKRQEAAVIKRVRPLVVARDGRCRLVRDVGGGSVLKAVEHLFGKCRGKSEWAHLGDGRRFKTRGLPPEERHTTRDSLMLCDGHHDAYDAHRMEIETMTGDGADGPLRFTSDIGDTYAEAPDVE